MTHTIQINGDQALDLLLNRVRDHEDFVYSPFKGAPSCRYENEGCPSCLIGGALFDAGVSVEKLRAMDSLARRNDLGGECSLSNAICDIAETTQFGFTLTEKALCVFTAAQESQDLGFPWAHAFSCAVQTAASYGPEVPA